MSTKSLKVSRPAAARLVLISFHLMDCQPHVADRVSQCQSVPAAQEYLKAALGEEGASQLEGIPGKDEDDSVGEKHMPLQVTIFAQAIKMWQ